MKSKFILFPAIISLIIHQLSFSQSWIYTELTSPVTTSLNSVCMIGPNSFDPQQVWICGDGGVVLRTTSSGQNWNTFSMPVPVNINLNTISSKARDTVLTAGNIGSNTYVYRTTNSGTNWVLVFQQSGGKINSIWMRNSVSGFMAGDPVGGRWSLWKTANGGVSWDSTGLYLPQASGETGFRNSLAVMNNTVIFGTNNSRIYRSTNLGVNWTFMTTPEQNSSAVWNYWDTLFSTYTLSGGRSINATTNFGLNWVLNPCPDTNAIVGFCPAYYGVLMNAPMGKYAVRNNSKIYYAGFGNTFINEYTAPAGNYNHIAYDVMVMYSMLTFGVRSNGGITKISLFRGGGIRNLSDVIPEKFELEQNFPNPFNPVTNIRFSVSREMYMELSVTKLQIIDLLGRTVDVPVNERLMPGEYELTYDASRLPSGLYFYRLVTGRFSDVKKMILIK